MVSNVTEVEAFSWSTVMLGLLLRAVCCWSVGCSLVGLSRTLRRTRVGRHDRLTESNAFSHAMAAIAACTNGHDTLGAMVPSPRTAEGIGRTCESLPVQIPPTEVSNAEIGTKTL